MKVMDGMAFPAAAEPVDVAVNIFAKPFQTALSLLSLFAYSGRHVGDVYLQFEPYGSRHDQVSPYRIADYLKERIGERCHVFQPAYWLDLNAADPSRLSDPAYRLGIRYQYAFERSARRKLFLMHNDVLLFRDLIGDMLGSMGDAFAIGQLGQCWNCPASSEPLMREAFGRGACGPDRYGDFRPSSEELRHLYALARQRGVFVRPYDEGFAGEFDPCPWPLPECRINEWACLLDLEKTRPHTVPFGPLLPPGAYRPCGPVCLDIGVAWFRGMHGLGLRARHFPLASHMKHWVGTGKITPMRYRKAEDHALHLLRRHYPAYLAWLDQATGGTFSRTEVRRAASGGVSEPKRPKAARRAVPVGGEGAVRGATATITTFFGAAIFTQKTKFYV